MAFKKIAIRNSREAAETDKLLNEAHGNKIRIIKIVPRMGEAQWHVFMEKGEK